MKISVTVMADLSLEDWGRPTYQNNIMNIPQWSVSIRIVLQLKMVLQPWRWRQYVPLKCWYLPTTHTESHSRWLTLTSCGVVYKHSCFLMIDARNMKEKLKFYLCCLGSSVWETFVTQHMSLILQILPQLSENICSLRLSKVFGSSLQIVHSIDFHVWYQLYQKYRRIHTIKRVL
jgi:hypothetical protein